MKWTLSSLLFLSSAAAAAEVPRLSVQQLRTHQDSGTNVHDLISYHGMLRVVISESASETRRAALTSMCKCSAFADEDVLTSHPIDMEKKILNDHTERRTVGTASFGLSRTLDLPS